MIPFVNQEGIVWEEKKREEFLDSLSKTEPGFDTFNFFTSHEECCPELRFVIWLTWNCYPLGDDYYDSDYLKGMFYCSAVNYIIEHLRDSCFKHNRTNHINRKNRELNALFEIAHLVGTLTERESTPDCKFNEQASILHSALDAEKVKDGINRIMKSKDQSGETAFCKVHHWFVVVKVLKEIDWIDNGCHVKDIIEWLQNEFNASFNKNNYDRVSRDYKQKASFEWTPNMPHGKSFVDLAAALRRELRGNEDKYKVRPDLYIWHPSEDKN